MTVAELIAHLQTQPQDMQVAYPCHSEFCILESEDIRQQEACESRQDGWVQRKRTDKPARAYLMLPGG